MSSRVVAPVGWFPASLARWLPGYAHLACVPAEERRHGLDILHPRFPVLPKRGMTIAPFLLFAWSLPVLRRLRRESGDFDLIDAHYFYPDGVAAALLGKALRKPVVITARGTDINLLPRYALPRRMIRYAARESRAVIAVSQALKHAILELGVSSSRVHVLRNGVDLEAFRPIDRSAARAALGLKGPTLLSVGNLIETKGHHLVVEALRLLPQHSLLVVGEGPQRRTLEHLAAQHGLAGRVRLLGGIEHGRLAQIYGAADALVLASVREGWPNVLLEAMACGTPVVASRVGGIPEVVARPEAGLLMADRTPQGVAAAVRELFAALPDRAATRRYAENFSWEATTQGQIELFSAILGGAQC